MAVQVYNTSLTPEYSVSSVSHTHLSVEDNTRDDHTT
jgi:hypothetical protein